MSTGGNGDWSPGRLETIGQTVGAAADLEFKTLFLDRELGELRALHEFDDLLNLF